ncbi:MAG: hypothetical protein LUG95_01515 [Clostridiales bacterium]|nr:hypothetical protein [Clostridiales bacterium]
MESDSWSSDSLATIKSGASVRVISSFVRWYKVIYNNKTGYVYNLAFKKSGSSNLSRTKVTTSNYTTYLDDVLFNIGKSQKAIYDYVCKNMSYSYAKISTQQKKANISSLSSVNKNTVLLTTVAITKKRRHLL